MNGKTTRKQAGTGILPHGMVPFQHLRDSDVRDVVMKLNENIAALSRRLLAIENRLKEK